MQSVCNRGMTDYENDIHDAARNMIERYGQKASREVELRILELQARNQQDALRLWREIKKRVDFLLAGASGESKH